MNYDAKADSKSNLQETAEERRARIYPVILSEYNPEWPKWFEEWFSLYEKLFKNKCE
ncbi:MAG: GrpB family protein [Clostridiaceae bacterium]|jgi:hypothetical protein|nr:GrpB family protein [Clostridiaceae bacterium]